MFEGRMREYIDSICQIGTECVKPLLRHGTDAPDQSQDAETTTSTVAEGECSSNADCDRGEECIDTFCATTTSSSGCTDDSDCRGTQSCDAEGECVRSAAGSVGDECSSNEDCRGSKVCLDGSCQRESADRCGSDEECRNSQRCVDGECQRDRAQFGLALVGEGTDGGGVWTKQHHLWLVLMAVFSVFILFLLRQCLIDRRKESAQWEYQAVP